MQHTDVEERVAGSLAKKSIQSNPDGGGGGFMPLSDNERVSSIVLGLAPVSSTFLLNFNTGSNDDDVTVSKLCISESKVSCEHCVASPSARESFECSRVHSAAKN